MGSVIDDDLSYDYRGLITSAYNTYRRGQTAQVTASTAYNGLGAVVSATNHTTTSGASENFRVDAIGNRLRVARPGLKPSTHPDFWGVRFQSYDEHARLTGVADTTVVGTDDFVLSETYQYDGSGALSLQYSSEWKSGDGTVYDQTKSYPGIDDKLAVVNRHVGVSSASQSLSGRVGVYQENWYDALGRRVLVRARKPASCSSTTLGELACRSFIERTVWDGDQILIERRADGASGLTSSQLDQETSSGEAWGEVISIHALGIDAPVAVRKTGRTTLAPHANWMGDYEIGTTANGTPTSSCTGAIDCPVLLWPGGQETADGFPTDHSAINTWWGGLITEKTDPSGYKYMRNRYYNPQTGQFTQTDPIGLAGGVNLYGFAAGDPVNYSDPFGLCPIPHPAGQAMCQRLIQLGASTSAAAPRVSAALSAYGQRFTSFYGNLGRQVADRVLGHHPEYVQVGDAISAKTFNVPTRFWDKMSTAAQWAANKRFLDRGIADGAEFVMATRRGDIRAGTALAREVDYLLKSGYQWAENGLSLIKK